MRVLIGNQVAGVREGSMVMDEMTVAPGAPVAENARDAARSDRYRTCAICYRALVPGDRIAGLAVTGEACHLVPYITERRRSIAPAAAERVQVALNRAERTAHVVALGQYLLRLADAEVITADQVVLQRPDPG
jgi:hypothetical protein